MLLNIQEEMARPKRFELLTPRFVIWCSFGQSRHFRCARSSSFRLRKGALYSVAGGRVRPRESSPPAELALCSGARLMPA